jgi:hypothetical protein
MTFTDEPEIYIPGELGICRSRSTDYDPWSGFRFPPGDGPRRSRAEE